jgi:diguanylate cyclase (GGDEF)-like protein
MKNSSRGCHHLQQTGFPKPHPTERINVARKRQTEDRTETRRKHELLQRVSLFRKLKPDELDLIARYSGYEVYRDGDEVFAAGTNGESLFLVEQGGVRIIADKNGEAHDIARFIEGELFGELDLFEDAPRAVSAAAEADTVLLVFPKPGLSFASLLRRHPALFARILDKLLAQVAQRIRETNKLVSEKTPWIEDLRRQILFDKLTGLYNKNYLEEDFKTGLSRWGGASALLAIKPDNFKQVNDGYGHEAGDKALRRLAETITAAVGKAGIGVRYRGDELMAVLPGTDAAGARAAADKILAAIPAIDLAPIINTDAIRLTASIGVAVYPAHGGTSGEIVERAVARMFDARRDGGDRVYEVS